MSAPISGLTTGGAAQLTDLIRIARPDGSGGFDDFRLTLQAAIALANAVSPENIVEKYAAVTLGDGNGNTLAEDGYNLAQAQAAFPALESAWGIDVDVHTTDTAALFEALDSHRTGKTHVKCASPTYMLGLRAGEYLIKPPKDAVTSSNFTSRMFLFDGNGAAFNLLAGATTQSIFFTEINDQTENDQVVGWKNIFRNFTLRGRGATSTPDSIGLRLCSSKNAKIEDVKFMDIGTGLEIRSVQVASIIGCAALNCDIGYFAGIGDWSGAGASTAGGQPYFNGCFASVKDGGIGFYIDRMDSPSLNNCACDVPTGDTGEYGIYLNNIVSSVSKNAHITNFRIEGQFNKAAIGIKGRDHGCINIDTVYSQISDYLLELHLTASSSTVVLSNICDDFGKLRYRSDTGMVDNGSGILKGGGGVFRFRNCKLPGNPDTAEEIANSPLIWDTTAPYGYPDDGRVIVESLWHP